MKIRVCGLSACSICPRPHQIVRAVLDIAIEMRDAGRFDHEIRDAVEEEALAICAACTGDDECDAIVTADEIEVDMYPRGSVPTALYA